MADYSEVGINAVGVPDVVRSGLVRSTTEYVSAFQSQEVEDIVEARRAAGNDELARFNASIFGVPAKLTELGGRVLPGRGIAKAVAARSLTK